MPFSIRIVYLHLRDVLVLTVFNQKTLYDAYKKRTKNIEVDMDAYNKAKEADPEFYRDASSLQYGKVLSVLSYHINKYFIVLFKVHVEIKSLFKSIGVLPCSGVKCPRRKYQQNGQGAQGA